MQFSGDEMELANKLRHLRKAARKSTYDIALATGFSQSKVSRIERGAVVPTFNDVVAIVGALDLNADVRRSILQRADEVATSKVRTPRSGKLPQMGFDARQLREIELSCRTNMSLAWTHLPGSVQTLDYIERVYEPSVTSMSIRDYVHVRQLRQADAIAYAGSWIEVMPAEMLMRPLLTLSAWIEQLEQIKRRLRYPGARLGIIPIETKLTETPEQVQVVDRDLAIHDSGATLAYWDRASIDREYQRFKSFEKIAVWEADAEKLVDEAIGRLQTVDLRAERQARR